MTGRRSRGEQVRFEVTGWQHYGVLVRTEDDEVGWVEAEYISDLPLEQSDWPPAGTTLNGLVLGYTQDGRVRVCLRTVDGRPSPDHWPIDSD
jgi:hypothetical protein